MTQVTIHEAKTHLSRLIQRALKGEKIIIARGKKPLVELVVLPSAKQERRLGGAAKSIIEISEDFDEFLEEYSEYAP